MSTQRNTNQTGFVLSIFIVLTGVILWFTGNLHFGPAQVMSPDQSHEGHAHGNSNAMCAEHGVLESECTICKSETDHCETSHASSATDLADLEKAMCEHGMPAVDCDKCRFEVGVVKIEPFLSESLIQTGLVQDIDRAKTLKLTGQIVLDKTRVVDIVPSCGGRVERVEKLLGQKVKKNDVLAVIHSADLGQAKANFLEVQAKLELTQATFKREKGLYEKKVSSEADYLNALNEFKASEAYYTSAERRLRLFGLETEQIAQIKQEKENGKFAQLLLKAPRSGTIIAQNISAGRMVDTTQSLYTIADLSNVWLWCDLYEKDLAVLHEEISKGNSPKAVVHVKAFENTGFEGVIDLIDNVMDEHTRTVKVRVQVPNKQGKLKPGMFAHAEVMLSLEGRMTVVPITAILSDAGQNFTFQHWKKDLWVRRDVVLGTRQGDFVEILGGV
ncbi:MAG: efflux RND transporter periplasmic adaptor subunit, partial [Planctomycetota bacterium]